MIERKPRIVGALVGDIEREPSARTKYGYLFDAIQRRFPLAGVYDATLRGPRQLINILLSIHLNRRVWRQRSYKHPAGFRIRSRLAASHLASLGGKADLALQVGVLFDARWNNIPLPSVIYTDYTAQLSARRPDAGRSPFTPGERAAWIELERQAFERAAHICTRGQLVRDSVLNDYGIPPERVTAIGGGANFAELPPVNEPAAGEAPTALFIGKEFYRKGGDLLLTAFSQVRAIIPQAQLRLLTGDDIPPGLPLEGVEIFRPTWDREAIAALYRHADLFVLPSRLETWGDVLLEAMAYGLPCIGVVGQAMQEIIEDGQTGLLVPPEDPGALASAMSRLLGNASLRRQWGCAARRKLESEYTWDRVVDRLAPIIEAVHFTSNRQSVL
jgi:glycosyltransferase involved in cell wall biosynthesis